MHFHCEIITKFVSHKNCKASEPTRASCMSNAEPLHSLLLLLQGTVGAKVDYFKLQQSTILQQSIKKRKKLLSWALQRTTQARYYVLSDL